MEAACPPPPPADPSALLRVALPPPQSWLVRIRVWGRLRAGRAAASLRRAWLGCSGAGERLGQDRRLFLAVVAGALAVLVAFMVGLRPASPFEWDEVLFLRALDGYDVSRHSPHPPGYPLYVAAAWALARSGVGHLLALQLVSVLGAVVALVGAGRAMRRLGAGRGATLVAGVLLAGTPAFAFHAAVGMADMLATGLAAFALWAAAAAIAEPGRARHLHLLAVAAALAVATRPQVLVLLLIPGLWALGRSLRLRRWQTVGLATLAGAAVSAACWLPAILLTGWPRYWAAVDGMRRWVEVEERGCRLPGAPLGLVLDAWLVRPFATPVIASALWALVLLGAVGWWRSGRRRLVLLAAPAAGVYLLLASFTLQLDTCVRYALPALPCLAMLAAGVTRLEPRPLARAGVAAALALAALQAAWLTPTLTLRATEPAPVWAALEWVREHAPPRTAVVHDVAVKPHARFLLRAADVRLAEVGSRRAEAFRREVWHVHHDPGPELAGEVLFAARWPADPLARLTRHRYLAAAVVSTGG